MSSPFVWFHHNGQKSKQTSRAPAGEFTGGRDPGGAALALWKKV